MVPLRYIETFDRDRTFLDMAYAEKAVFSCSVHHVVHPSSSLSMAGLFAPPDVHSHSTCLSHISLYSLPLIILIDAHNSTLCQGRSDIVDKICLLGPYQFCPRGQQANLYYDVVSLGSPTRDGLLLKVHGEIVNPNPAGPHLDIIVTLDQSFILKYPLPAEDNDQNSYVYSTI